MMPGPKSGTHVRNQRCRETTGLSWSELCVLVAIYAHERAVGRIPTRVDLEAFALRVCELAEAGYQVNRLKSAAYVEPRRTARGLGYQLTARGYAKVGGLLGGRHAAAGAAE